MARQGLFAASSTDRTNTPACRMRRASERLDEPFRTPETSSTTSLESSSTPGSSIGTPIWIDSDDEKDGTPTKQKRSDIRPSQDSSARSLRSSFLDIPLRAKHTTRVSEKEEILDVKSNDNTTGDAQANKEDAVNSTHLIHARLSTIVCGKLPNSEEEGFIYVFRDLKHTGAVKIGYTKDINRRTKEHEKCGLKLSFVHISGRVKEMKRAEQLIKADLRHLRTPWKCSACKRTHDEWFEIDEETAKARVTLWVEWINDRDPYDSNGNIKPLWRYLIEYGRNPREEFDSKNHEARWRHWDWVLSKPLPSEIPMFEKHERKSSSMRRRTMPSRFNDSEQTAPTHQQIITHVDATSIEALQTLGIGQLLHAATQTATNNSINWTLNINVQCDGRGRQEIPSVSKSSRN